MLGEWSGQDLTIVADPADQLWVSEKHIVSSVMIWLKARDQSTSISVCSGSINHAEDERRMMEEKRVKTEICTFFKLQRRGITFSRS